MEPHLKVIVLGNAGVGKSSLIERFIHRRFRDVRYGNIIRSFGPFGFAFCAIHPPFRPHLGVIAYHVQ